jgi:membrane protease YdiL (CAAX protease family)
MEKLALNLQFVVLAGVLGLASLSWTLFFRLWLTGNLRNALKPEPGRSPPRWGLADLAVNILVFICLSLGVVQLLGFLGINPNPASDATRSKAIYFLALGVAQIAAVGLGTVAACIRARVPLRDSGWSLAHAAGDVQLGLFAFGLVVIPVFIVQAILVQIIEYEHPAITPFRESKDWVFFASAAFSAVIAAPLAEEYFFRGLVQAWLERFSLLGARNWEEAFLPRAEIVESCSSPLGNAPESTFLQAEVNPYAFESTVAGGEQQLVAAQAARVIPQWPIWVTSAIFALLHMSQGPAPVPLFLFSVAMGYVFRRTGRIFPCLVMHFLLNGLSMATLALTTLAPGK